MACAHMREIGILIGSFLSLSVEKAATQNSCSVMAECIYIFHFIGISFYLCLKIVCSRDINHKSAVAKPLCG